MVEWAFLVLSPILGALAALGVYSALRGAQNGSRGMDGDHQRNMEYRTWREWVVAQGGLRPVCCSNLPGGPDPCFAIEQCAALYEPQIPHCHCRLGGGPVFDTACGMPVGEGWSVIDSFGDVRFVSKGCLRVTARALLFGGGAGEMMIPIREIHTVAAACSSLLVGAHLSDRLFLFGDVNGQKLRDIISFLLEAA